MEVVVFGAGSLGSLLGGLLSLDDAHEVTLVGRNPHVARVREAGLRIDIAGADDPLVTDAGDGDGSVLVHPRATTDGAGLDADLALVTVKAPDVPGAARALATGRVDVALPLSNGLGHAETLAEHLDGVVLSGTTTYGAVRTDPGVVEYRGRGTVTFGARDAADGPAADRVGDALSRTLSVDVVDDVERVGWEKLAVNAAINPTTALAGARNGAVLDAPLRDVAGAAAREAAAAARSVGVDLTDERAAAAVERVARATADNLSSMAQDVAAGRETEVDAITGHVVRTAEAAGLDAPVCRTLWALVRARGAGADLDGDAVE